MIVKFSVPINCFVTVIVNVLGVAWLSSSVAVTVNVYNVSAVSKLVVPSISAPVKDNPVGSAPLVILNVIVPASGSVACNVIVDIVALEANVPKLPAAVVQVGIPL